MSTITLRANARTLPATNRRAVLGAALAVAGATAALSAFVGDLSPAAEDGEILDLRSEFERLEATRAPILEKHNELDWTFHKLLEKHGYDAAIAADTNASEFEETERQLEPLTQRAFNIVQRMLALQPKTLDEVAAVAATLKQDTLPNYWAEPEENRDFQEQCITRFFDSLIALAPSQAPEDADRVLAQGGGTA